MSKSPEDEVRSSSNRRRASRSLERSGSAGDGDGTSRTLDLSSSGGDEEDAGGDAFLRALPGNRDDQPVSAVIRECSDSDKASLQEGDGSDDDKFALPLLYCPHTHFNQTSCTYKPLRPACFQSWLVS